VIDPAYRALPKEPRRRASPRVVGLVALAVLTAVVAVQKIGGRATTKSSSATTAIDGAGTTLPDPGPTTSGAPTATTLSPSPKPLPPGGLYPGGRPPMFVLVSFDGAADQALLTRWSNTMAKAKGNMTLFLSAVYMVGDENKAAYKGPRHNAGESAVGFAPTKGAQTGPWLTTTIEGLRSAQDAGHELENHFGGHWCGASGVKSWNRADWAAEINQFDNVMAKIDTINKLDPPVGSPFLRPAIGSRTPCLEGNLEELFPVLKARGYKFDASRTRLLDAWPVRKLGLWSFGFPSITVEGISRPTLPVDFTLRANTDKTEDASVTEAADISRRVLEGYMKAFDSLYYGNRAPFELSNHFVTFTHDAFNIAVEKFLLDVCVREEVQCVNYRQLSDWLADHEGDLTKFGNGNFTKALRPAA
jgi:hypothetical protein